MKTMKKITALVLSSVLAISFSAFSQKVKDKADDGKMHIKVEIEKDGKTTKIDTTINPEQLSSLNDYLKDVDVQIGDMDDLPKVQAFAFGLDGENLKDQVKALVEQLKDKEINLDEFEKQMKDADEQMKNLHYLYKYNYNTDGDSDKELLELEKGLDSLDNMNFNFNFNNDGKDKTIIISGDDIKINGDKNGKGNKEIIIKKKSTPDGKDQKHKETKKVTIIMKSSAVPEKKETGLAIEPQKNEVQSEQDDANRVRVVDKKDNSWLDELVCYPNPSSGEFTVSFKLSNPEAAELKIMDFAGREVFAENIPENTERVEKQIKLPSTSSADYLLILRQGNNWYHEKISVKS